MNSKTSIFHYLKEFIYSPKLEDLHVFSKEYLNSVLKPYYSSNSEKENYAAICIDFNKLNDINNKYSYQTGDKIIHYSLFLMKSVLPPNSICARIGGDEFVFLINDCNPGKIESLIFKIDSILKEHEKELLFSSVTSYGVHSEEKNSLSEMIAEADLKITEQKNNFNRCSLHSKWGVLENKLNQNLTSFFKSLRLYKEPITTDFLKKLYMHAIYSCGDLLEKDFNRIIPNSEEQISTYPFDENELDKLYSIFLKKAPSNEEINDIDESSYSYLLNNLIHDSITGNFSKSYFTKYLLKDCNKEFKIKYLSTSFMKLYNAIFSHNATDIKGNEMVTNFLNYLKEDLGITFSNDGFSDKPQNYFVSLGAGDYLVAMQELEEEKSINDKINNYFSSIEQDTSNLSDILRLFCSKDFHLVNKENCDTLLDNLANECKESKDDYKVSILNEPMIKDALNNIIYDSAEYYIDNIPRSNNINNKNRFLHLLTELMLNISIELNKEQEQKNNKNTEER